MTLPEFANISLTRKKFNNFFVYVVFFIVFWLFLGFFESNKIKLELLIQSDNPFSAQVFWTSRFSRSFSESKSFSLEILENDEFKSYMFEIPSNANLENIRIDPLNGIGTLKIKQINLIVNDSEDLVKVIPIDFSRIYGSENLHIESLKNQIVINSITDDGMLFLNAKYQVASNLHLTKFISNLDKANQEKFFSLSFLATLGIVFLLSKRLKISFRVSIFAILISFLISGLIIRLVTKFYFPIQSVEKAIGHMNYNGLSKALDQSVLFLYIFLIPLIYLLLIKLFNRRGRF
jgi:hypothetical protein